MVSDSKGQTWIFVFYLMIIQLNHRRNIIILSKVTSYSNLTTFIFLVIQKLAEILKNCRDESKFFIKSVIPITQAKVPIVKFEYVFNKVEYEGDISYYNILGKKGILASYP